MDQREVRSVGRSVDRKEDRLEVPMGVRKVDQRVDRLEVPMLDQREGRKADRREDRSVAPMVDQTEGRMEGRMADQTEALMAGHSEDQRGLLEVQVVLNLFSRLVLVRLQARLQVLQVLWMLGLEVESV